MYSFRPSRREVLSRLATAFAGAVAIDQGLAREAHALVRQTAGRAPIALSAHEFRTLERLADLIIPVENGKPGALGAEVPAWIDALITVNATLRMRYTNGLAWLDSSMKARGAADFASATPAQQTALLDRIAFKKNASPELTPGIEFFTLARRMTVDGFYTSDAGVREILPGGRPPLGEFTVPQASVDYVISRSPFK